MHKLRISAGKWKNKKLNVPNDIRPVRERIKLAVFSILSDKVLDTNCLDLYAGSGSLGFEALSRGAQSCNFVDDDYHSVESMHKTETSLQVNENVINIIKDDSTKFVANTPEYYDIVFMDPPYELPVKHVLKYIHEMLKDNGMLIYFHNSKINPDIEQINSNLKITDTRTYGATQVDFIVK